MDNINNTVDMTGVPESWPEKINQLRPHRPDMGDGGDAMEMLEELGRVQKTSRKRKRVTYNTGKNTSRRSINVSEDNYYMNNEYLQTRRKYPLNCE